MRGNAKPAKATRCLAQHIKHSYVQGDIEQKETEKVKSEKEQEHQVCTPDY